MFITVCHHQVKLNISKVINLPNKFALHSLCQPGLERKYSTHIFQGFTSCPHLPLLKWMGLGPFYNFLCSMRQPLLLMVGQLILNLHLEPGFRAVSSRAVSKENAALFQHKILISENRCLFKGNYFELNLIKHGSLNNFKQHLFGERFVGHVSNFLQN